MREVMATCVDEILKKTDEVEFPCAHCGRPLLSMLQHQTHVDWSLQGQESHGPFAIFGQSQGINLKTHRDAGVRDLAMKQRLTLDKCTANCKRCGNENVFLSFFYLPKSFYGARQFDLEDVDNEFVFSVKIPRGGMYTPRGWAFEIQDKPILLARLITYSARQIIGPYKSCRQADSVLRVAPVKARDIFEMVDIKSKLEQLVVRGKSRSRGFNAQVILGGKR